MGLEKILLCTIYQNVEKEKKQITYYLIDSVFFAALEDEESHLPRKRIMLKVHRHPICTKIYILLKYTQTT